MENYDKLKEMLDSASGRDDKKTFKTDKGETLEVVWETPYTFLLKFNDLSYGTVYKKELFKVGGV